jgi:hypothetical protein
MYDGIHTNMNAFMAKPGAFLMQILAIQQKKML